MVTVIRVLALTVVWIAACERPTSPPDAGSWEDAGRAEAGVDAGDIDARVAVDAGRSDAGPVWDGLELPELNWTLPPCTEQYGVIERHVHTGPGDRQLSLRGMAAGGGRVIVEANRLVEVSSGEPVQVVLPNGDSLRDPVYALALASGQLRASAFIVPADGSPGRDHVISVVDAEVRAVRPEDLMYSPRAHGVVDESGVWRFLGLLWTDPERRFHDIIIDGDLEVVRAVPVAPELYPEEDHHLTRTPTGAMLGYLPLDDENAVRLVPYDDVEVRPTVTHRDGVIGPRGAIERMSLAADGDVVVLEYAISDEWGNHLERTAEVSLRTGELLRGPENFARLAPFYELELLSAPGGGIDVVHDSPTDGSETTPYNQNLPLHVHVGVPRPLALAGRTPLRVGAGAFATQFYAQRDGDRLVIAWFERGPTVDPQSPLNGPTAEGIYWAVLRCD